MFMGLLSLSRSLLSTLRPQVGRNMRFTSHAARNTFDWAALGSPLHLTYHQNQQFFVKIQPVSRTTMPPCLDLRRGPSKNRVSQPLRRLGRRFRSRNTDFGSLSRMTRPFSMAWAPISRCCFRISRRLHFRPRRFGHGRDRDH